MLVDALLACIALCGIGFAFGAHRFRDWVITVYDDPRVTKHLMVPGIAFLVTSLIFLLNLRQA